MSQKLFFDQTWIYIQKSLIISALGRYKKKNIPIVVQGGGVVDGIPSVVECAHQNEFAFLDTPRLSSLDEMFLVGYDAKWRPWCR